MRTYMIGYDLNKPGKDYSGLIGAIKEMFTVWWHNLDSTWIVRSNLTAEQIRDKLQPFLDSSDELLVTRLSGEGAWVGFSRTASDWLLNNL